MRHLACAMFLLFQCGCWVQSYYVCGGDDDCAGQEGPGRCMSYGYKTYCALPDSECGWRWDASAPAAGQCVGAAMEEVCPDDPDAP